MRIITPCATVLTAACHHPLACLFPPLRCARFHGTRRALVVIAVCNLLKPTLYALQVLVRLLPLALSLPPLTLLSRALGNVGILALVLIISLSFQHLFLHRLNPGGGCCGAPNPGGGAKPGGGGANPAGGGNPGGPDMKPGGGTPPGGG